MKQRPKGFLSPEKINHHSQVFDYIKELHEYLWAFVQTQLPGASGSLPHFVDDALFKAQQASAEKSQGVETKAPERNPLHDGITEEELGNLRRK
jgi:hypothetical protein